MSIEDTEILALKEICNKCHFNKWHRENPRSTLKQQWFICNVCENRALQIMPNIARGIKEIEIGGSKYRFPAQWSDNQQENTIHILTLALVLLNNPLANKVLDVYGTKVQDIDGNTFFPRDDMYESE